MTSNDEPLQNGEYDLTTLQGDLERYEKEIEKRRELLDQLTKSGADIRQTLQDAEENGLEIVLNQPFLLDAYKAIDGATQTAKDLKQALETIIKSSKWVEMYQPQAHQLLNDVGEEKKHTAVQLERLKSLLDAYQKLLNEMKNAIPVTIESSGKNGQTLTFTELDPFEARQAHLKALAQQEFTNLPFVGFALNTMDNAIEAQFQRLRFWSLLVKSLHHEFTKNRSNAELLVDQGDKLLKNPVAPIEDLRDQAKALNTWIQTYPQNNLHHIGGVIESALLLADREPPALKELIRGLKERLNRRYNDQDHIHNQYRRIIDELNTRRAQQHSDQSIEDLSGRMDAQLRALSQPAWSNRWALAGLGLTFAVSLAALALGIMLPSNLDVASTSTIAAIAQEVVGANATATNEALTAQPFVPTQTPLNEEHVQAIMQVLLDKTRVAVERSRMPDLTIEAEQTKFYAALGLLVTPTSFIEQPATPTPLTADDVATVVKQALDAQASATVPAQPSTPEDAELQTQVFEYVIQLMSQPTVSPTALTGAPELTPRSTAGITLTNTATQIPRTVSVTAGGNPNLRERPDRTAEIADMVEVGQTLQVIGQVLADQEIWCLVLAPDGNELPLYVNRKALALSIAETEELDEQFPAAPYNDS